MKKLIILIPILAIAATMILYFTTHKNVSSETTPVSSIVYGKVGFFQPTMKIQLANGHTTNVKMEDEFMFVHDDKIGHPNGHFTLTKQTNIFGHTRYTAHNLQS